MKKSTKVNDLEINATNKSKEALNVQTFDCSKWLENVWKEKEERLNLFYRETNETRRKFVPSGAGHKWPVVFL